MKSSIFTLAVFAILLGTVSCQHCYNCLPTDFQSDLYNRGVETIAQRYREAGDSLYYSVGTMELTTKTSSDYSYTKTITVLTAYTNIYFLWNEYDTWNDARLEVVSANSYYAQNGLPYFITQAEYDRLDKPEKKKYICLIQPYK